MWLKCENIYIKWCSFAYSFRWGLVSVTFSQCLIKKSNIRSCCFRRHPIVDPIVGFHRHHHPVVGFFVFSCVMLLSPLLRLWKNYYFCLICTDSLSVPSLLSLRLYIYIFTGNKILLNKWVRVNYIYIYTFKCVWM